MSKKLDRIARILADQDVRDPRNTLDAIAEIIDQQAPSLTSEDINRMLNDLNEQAKANLNVPHQMPADPHNDIGDPVGTLYIYNDPGSPGPLKVVAHFEYCGKDIGPRHIEAAILTLEAFDEKMRSA